MAAAMMATSRLTPRLASRFGTRLVCASGLTLIAIGMAIMAQLEAHSSYSLMAVGLVVLGVGMGAAMTPATSAITEALPTAQQGFGSALNDLAREVGGAIGIAILGSLLSATYRSSVDVSGLPAHVATRVKESFAVAPHTSGPIAARASDAFVTAMHVALLTASGIALVAAVGLSRCCWRAAPRVSQPARPSTPPRQLPSPRGACSSPGTRSDELVRSSP